MQVRGSFIRKIVFLGFILCVCPPYVLASDTSSEEVIQQLHAVKQKYEPGVLKEWEEQLFHPDLKLIGHVPLKDYDVSVKAPNEHRVGLCRADNVVFKVFLKPRTECQAQIEEGAYKISRKLGLNIVPPTRVWKEDMPGLMPNKTWILAYLIDPEEDFHPWKIVGAKGYKTVISHIPSQKITEILAFAYVFGNWDVKFQNLVFTKTSEAFWIDNEMIGGTCCYHGQDRQPYVLWRRREGQEKTNQKLECDIERIKAGQVAVLKSGDVSSMIKELAFYFPEKTSEEDIIKRTISYFWGKAEINCYLGEGGWWIQLYGGSPAYQTFDIMSHKEALTAQTKEAFEILDQEILESFFPSLSPLQKRLILERRDHLLSL